MVKVYRKVSPQKSSHEADTMQVCRLFYKLPEEKRCIVKREWKLGYMSSLVNNNPLNIHVIHKYSHIKKDTICTRRDSHQDHKSLFDNLALCFVCVSFYLFLILFFLMQCMPLDSKILPCKFFDQKFSDKRIIILVLYSKLHYTH